MEIENKSIKPVFTSWVCINKLQHCNWY